MTCQPTSQVNSISLEQRLLEKLRELKSLSLEDGACDKIHAIIYEFGHAHPDRAYTDEFFTQKYDGLSQDKIRTILIGHCGLSGELGHSPYRNLLAILEYYEDDQVLDCDDVRQSVLNASEPSQLATEPLTLPEGVSFARERVIEAPYRVIEDIRAWGNYHRVELADQYELLQNALDEFQMKYAKYTSILDEMKLIFEPEPKIVAAIPERTR